MRASWIVILPLFALAAARAQEPPVVAKPDAFPTLVNPNCSHCLDEAKRRAGELQKDDPVLAWTRGYSDGGAIPLRFFLAKHRVISDSYGVFVYDPDAGFARGFAPSYHFVFHGWRNGIMVIKDTTDDTLYSALSGHAFEGLRKGQRLKTVPTLTTTWGRWLKDYPHAVAYHMFDKYQPVELPTKSNDDSVKMRPAKPDARLKAEELVLGVRVGEKTRAYPLSHLQNVTRDELGGEPIIILHNADRTLAAYHPVASPPRKFKAPNPDKNGVSPADLGEPLAAGNGGVPAPRRLTFQDSNLGPLDLETHSSWDVTGRSTAGPLKGWTLEPVDAVVCKWFAWSAEYPETEVVGHASPDHKGGQDATKEVAGAAEFLRLLPKPFATLRGVDEKARTLTLLMDGETVAKVWPIEPDAEIKVMGLWGRLDQFKVGDRVWVWLKLNRKRDPVAVCMIADEPSEQDIHGDALTVKGVEGLRVTFEAKKKPERTLGWTTGEPLPKVGEKLFVQSVGTQVRWAGAAKAFEDRRKVQQAELRKRWEADGLPGTVSVQHVFSGELELLLDHEGMRWARSLASGDVVHIAALPPIKAVVKSVAPWRERTLLRLVVGELAAADLKSGDRVQVRMAPPRDDIVAGRYPPAIDRPRMGEERVEWFLANIYCVCKVRGDICTGHFYTLASCNPNGCGAPNETRKYIREMIDKGLKDREIWDVLTKERGVLLHRPHLLP